jgi:DNA-binding transcriptional regulator LsrR (DeoR family)
MRDMNNQEKLKKAICISRMYFYQNMTMDAIAYKMATSRSSISRLIKYAEDTGLIKIQIIDPVEQSHLYEKSIENYFSIEKAHVVPVQDFLGETVWLERVAQYSAKYISKIFDSNMILGIAWGTTLSAISKYLSHKTTNNSQIIQLNGAGNTRTMGIDYASEILVRFGKAFSARVNLFPVPTFFDFPETKNYLWKEKSIKRILSIQNNANILLFSIGAVNAGVPSHVYSGGYLSKEDYQELKRMKIVGDIATVFFREDGSYKNIPINKRASGPNLDFIKEKHGVCVVSGLAKVKGLFSALKGGLMKEIIVDEPTARKLIEKYIEPS